MASTRPTSRQLQGHFNALRATKSHTGSETIDIAAGNYSSGKTFSGATNISHLSWVGATDTFCVYFDQYDSLVLNNTTDFPPLSTWIAKVIIVGGIIIDVIDERAVVNGAIDAYQVAIDDSDLNVAQPASNVQEAIELLDAYISSIELIHRQKYIDLDIEGGIKNGLVTYTHVNDSPAISFNNYIVGVGRIRYSLSIPNDWVSGTDMVVKIFWSAPNSIIGNVKWRLRYRMIESGVDNVDEAMTTITYLQSTSGVSNKLINSGNNILINSNNINSGNILIINVERENAIDDTYNYEANMHLVRIEYIGKGLD